MSSTSIEQKSHYEAQMVELLALESEIVRKEQTQLLTIITRRERAREERRIVLEEERNAKIAKREAQKAFYRQQ